MSKKTCMFEGCGRKIHGKGLCKSHRRQQCKGEELTVLRQDLPSEERFLSNIEKTDTCWLWAGSCNNHGYGSISINGKLKGVHRYAYELFVGPIPTDHTVHHICAVTNCVNPAHLELCTQRQNNGEMMERRAYKARIAALETQVDALTARILELEAQAAKP